MSLFYNNQRSSNPNQNSVVRPYNENMYPDLQAPSNPNKSKRVEPAYDPLFPPRHPNSNKRSQQQQSQQPMEKLRKSIPLANKQDEKQSCLTKLCNCPQLETFKRYFTVSNSVVLRRILLSFQFWRPTFFTQNQDQLYDFYGPFWIYTTLVFCLSAVPNILLYQGIAAFAYNFEIVGLSFGFIYLQGFLFPIALTFMLNVMGVNCSYIQNICLYGYSLCVCIVCVLICSVNVCILHYVLLGYAFVSKALFVLGNFNKGYQIPIAKKAVIMGLVIGEAALQFFIVKFFFIQCVDDGQQSQIVQVPRNGFHNRVFQI